MADLSLFDFLIMEEDSSIYIYFSIILLGENMYKTIPSATDMSPRSIYAIESAFSLAEKFNAKLHIFKDKK